MGALYQRRFRLLSQPEGSCSFDNSGQLTEGLSVLERSNRAARRLFAVARCEHVLQMFKIRGMLPGCPREGSVDGPAELKDVFCPASQPPPLAAAIQPAPTAKRQAVSVVVLGCWLLMRELEIVDVRPCDTCFWQRSAGPPRADEASVLLCEYSPSSGARFAQLRLSRRSARSTRSKSLVALKCVAAPRQPSVQRFEDHALRVPGAQLLARRLIPLYPPSCLYRKIKEPQRGNVCAGCRRSEV